MEMPDICGVFGRLYETQITDTTRQAVGKAARIMAEEPEKLRGLIMQATAIEDTLHKHRYHEGTMDMKYRDWETYIHNAVEYAENQVSYYRGLSETYQYKLTQAEAQLAAAIAAEQQAGQG